MCSPLWAGSPASVQDGVVSVMFAAGGIADAFGQNESVVLGSSTAAWWNLEEGGEG